MRRPLCVEVLSILLAIAPACRAEVPAAPAASPQLLHDIAGIKDQTGIQIALAAISLQEMVVASPAAYGKYEETLAESFGRPPTVLSSRTPDGRAYVLVVFLDADPSGGSLVIFQHCFGGLLIRERGFAHHPDRIIRGFTENANTASTDYYKVDACKQFEAD